MSAITDIRRPVAYKDQSPKTSRLTGHRMAVSRVIGALFLAGFMFYGVGSVLATSVTGGSNFLSTISVNKTLLILGAFLIYITIPSIIAEISILVYLLVFGVRTRKSDEQFLAA